MLHGSRGRSIASPGSRGRRRTHRVAAAGDGSLGWRATLSGGGDPPSLWISRGSRSSPKKPHISSSSSLATQLLPPSPLPTPPRRTSRGKSRSSANCCIAATANGAFVPLARDTYYLHQDRHPLHAAPAKKGADPTATGGQSPPAAAAAAAAAAVVQSIQDYDGKNNNTMAPTRKEHLGVSKESDISVVFSGQPALGDSRLRLRRSTTACCKGAWVPATASVSAWTSTNSRCDALECRPQYIGAKCRSITCRLQYVGLNILASTD